ncbi:adenylate/guanylate cyclase domain-containing protein [Ruegeria hyattellae]|uniref:adenylate/guanylate cyclase domain-containing protein n=1 Tax=Ruegeria hyattellae TaxID=3233337 RepID=UPI00355BEB97
MVHKNHGALIERLDLFRWTIEAIGRNALPIRVKLPFAFLVVVGLMVALALTGVSELRQANKRASDLVDDQIRISTLRSIGRSIQAIRLVGAELFLNHGDSATNKSLASRFNDEVFLFRAAAGQTGLNNRATFFITPDYEQDYYVKERDVQSVASLMRNLFAKGDIAAARAVYDTDFLEALDTFDRVVSSISFELGQEMRARAVENAAAFERARRMVLGASGFAIALALILGFSISASITRSLDRIRWALGEIAVGNFNTRVNVPNRDELGELAGHANQTSAKLGELYDAVERQKAELAELNSALEIKVQTQVEEIERTNRLRRFLPTQVAEMIVAAPDELDILRTQRAEITVLFVDLRGFTAFANAATPVQVVESLNAFHGACGPLIEASGGTLERFLGDGLMVLFGAPVALENAPQRAANLAIELREAVRKAMGPIAAGSETCGLGVGIGIGTGAATLGQIGFEGRRDYSAIGPAPNLAARLCEQAVDGQILISHATAWQIESDLQPAGPFDLKGIGDSIAAFELVAQPDEK